MSIPVKRAIPYATAGVISFYLYHYSEDMGAPSSFNTFEQQIRQRVVAEATAKDAPISVKNFYADRGILAKIVREIKRVDKNMKL